MRLTKNDIKVWIDATSGEWFELGDIKKELQVDDTQYSNLRKALHDLCKDGVCEALGGKTGRYRKVATDLTPVKFWESVPLECKLAFPQGIDGTSFSFEKWIELEPVSTITIGGVSNSGKTALGVGLLLYNVINIYNNINYISNNTNRIKYFSSENNRYNFWKRIQKVDFVDVFVKHPPVGLTDCKFDYIPKRDNYADFIYGSFLYIIDWINLTDEIWKIGKVISDIKDKLSAQGEGIAVIILQKDDKKPNPRGDTWVKDHSDLLMTIDFLGQERKLTIVKCKVNGFLDGKMWAFSLDEGVFFKNIREIVICDKCHGSGKSYDKYTHGTIDCSFCTGGYRDKEEDNHDVV